MSKTRIPHSAPVADAAQIAVLVSDANRLATVAKLEKLKASSARRAARIAARTVVEVRAAAEAARLAEIARLDKQIAARTARMLEGVAAITERRARGLPITTKPIFVPGPKPKRRRYDRSNPQRSAPAS